MAQNVSMDVELNNLEETRRHVDPPRLDNYRADPSPKGKLLSIPVKTRRSRLDTLVEAMTPRLMSRKPRDMGGFGINTVSAAASSYSVGIATSEGPSSERLTELAGNAPVLLRIGSSTVSETLPPNDRYPYSVTPASTAIDQSTILPPTQRAVSPTVDGLNKPTCSLNLMCYRPGSQGCIRRQIQVVRKSSEEYPGMIRTDQEFFHALHREYEQYICGFWRRYLSLKTLRQIRLLSFTPMTRPEVVSTDDFTLQEVFYAYKHPEDIKIECEWIDWVFRLRQADRRHALEFVEDWSGFRIGLIGSLPWVVATVVGVVWTVRGGDVQTAFTVAAFILTVGTSLLALLAIVSKIES